MKTIKVIFHSFHNIRSPFLIDQLEMQIIDEKKLKKICTNAIYDSFPSILLFFL